MREYYAFALIAGIGVSEARRMMPGFIMDMFKIRTEYDVRVGGGKIEKRKGLLM